MKKILPICESPQCLDLHTSAFPLSILNADSRFSERWLIQNLIPIEYAKRYGNVLTYDLPLFGNVLTSKFHFTIQAKTS